MTATDNWAKGLPQPHSTILISLASSWEHTYSVHNLLRTNQPLQATLTKPDLQRWLSFYTRHRLLTDEAVSHYLESLRHIFDSPHDVKLYGTREQPSSESSILAFERLRNIDTLDLPDMDGCALPLSVAFMILVWMPCLALYGDYPPVLLRKARLGDLDTICDLIKLDRSVTFDSGISKVIHSWVIEFQDVKLKRIGDAFRKGIPHVSKKRIKLAWAQYVYDAAKSFEMPLTAPKVRELFDALSQDASTGFHDPDLAEMTDDAFYQAIAKRKRPLSNILKYRQA